MCQVVGKPYGFSASKIFPRRNVSFSTEKTSFSITFYDVYLLQSTSSSFWGSILRSNTTDNPEDNSGGLSQDDFEEGIVSAKASPMSALFSLPTALSPERSNSAGSLGSVLSGKSKDAKGSISHPTSPSSEHESFFCSELVAAALKAIGLIPK